MAGSQKITVEGLWKGEGESFYLWPCLLTLNNQTRQTEPLHEHILAFPLTTKSCGEMHMNQPYKTHRTRQESMPCPHHRAEHHPSHAGPVTGAFTPWNHQLHLPLQIPFLPLGTAKIAQNSELEVCLAHIMWFFSKITETPNTCLILSAKPSLGASSPQDPESSPASTLL